MVEGLKWKSRRWHWVEGLEIGGSKDLNNIKDDWDGCGFMVSDDVDLIVWKLGMEAWEGTPR